MPREFVYIIARDFGRLILEDGCNVQDSCTLQIRRPKNHPFFCKSKACQLTPVTHFG